MKPAAPRNHRRVLAKRALRDRPKIGPAVRLLIDACGILGEGAQFVAGWRLSLKSTAVEQRNDTECRVLGCPHGEHTHWEMGARLWPPLRASEPEDWVNLAIATECACVPNDVLSALEARVLEDPEKAARELLTLSWSTEQLREGA